MDMQDKEFDELFRSRLENISVQPPAVIWENISAQLANGKRKKLLIPFLSAAAGIVVMLIAGILFISQRQHKGNRQLVQNKSAKVSYKQHFALTAKNISKPGKTNLPAPGNPAVIYAKPGGGIIKQHIKELKHVAPNKSLIADTVMNAAKNNVPLFASANQTEKAAVKNIVPDEDTQLTVSAPVTANPVFMTGPEATTVHLPAADKHEVLSAKKKHRIKSFGDMVNVVVAKIDKRKDKFVEFSDTDGDEATITSVNLGIIKINK